MIASLKETIARHGLAARKSLGQHFLLDLNLTRKIARAAGDLSSGTTIEIGPGPGGLTRALIEGGGVVIAIERDQRCIEALQELVVEAAGRLRLIAADALEIPAHELGVPPRRIVANLPYNIGTPLLLGWLAHPAAFESLTLMFQREVVQRLIAQPGEDHYGRLAVATQWHWRAERLFDIDPRAFTPPPKVFSAVVRLTPRPAPVAPADPRLLERVVAAAFGQRRKMLRQSLRALGADVAALLEAAEIDGTRRAEELSIMEFAALARALNSLRASA